MYKNFTYLIVFLCVGLTTAFAQPGNGSIKGNVLDKETNEPVAYAEVKVLQTGIIKGGAYTDDKGDFIVSQLPPGEYTIVVKFFGYAEIQIQGVIVKSDKMTPLSDPIALGKDSEMLGVVEIVQYEVPLIDKDGGASGATITRDDIEKMSVRSATGIAETVGGVTSSEGGGGLSVRGSRSDANYYYIDGIKVRGSSNLPKAAIQEVSVITGGLPASYGDVTGGIISITTRGPSAFWFGSIEGVSSGFSFMGDDPNGYDQKVYGLDSYGYNLVEGMIAGPLLMKKDSEGNKTTPLIGFILSGNYTDQIDSRPLFGGVDMLKKEYRDSLMSSPLRSAGIGAGTYYNTSFLTEDAFYNQKFRPNARSQVASAQAKLDFGLGKNIVFTVGGNFNWGKASLYSYSGSLMNWDNFGENTAYDYRVFGKFTQTFSQKEGSTSAVKSAYYTINVDYTQTYSNTYNPNFDDKVFNYGYIGQYDIYSTPNYEFNGDRDTSFMTGFRDTLVVFTPSEVNASMAAITNQYFQLYDSPVGRYQNIDQIQGGGGLINGQTPDDVYGVWTNMGTPYNSYSVGKTSQFRVTGSGNLVIGGHTVTLGFEYEQRNDKAYAVAPVGLWTNMRNLMNTHINELDLSNPMIEDYGTYLQVSYDRLNSSPGDYQGEIGQDNQTFFDYSVRNKLGYDTDGIDYINILGMDPNFFELSMFSAEELLNSGNSYVTYYGYNHYGEELKGSDAVTSSAAALDAYFNDVDENGNYKRNWGAYRPTYIAGYIMDKFAFDDIIFNVGLRVDVFNTNQPVLKDPYLLYEAKTIADLDGDALNVEAPSNLSNDAVVYVDDVNNPNYVTGYRDGDKWYDATGAEIADPSTLEGPAGIAPYLVNPDDQTINSSAFENYKAQVSIMPRIAFSFPISDNAAFFAHYDILTQRPGSGVRFDPVAYQFLNNSSNSIINNPNLKPSQTIDYAIGFQQAISNSAALKVEAFYREQRNMIQLVKLYGVYPKNYITYGNIDFGTVKGLTLTYDMRRTASNIRMTASYTLQFAEGTGSNATSSLSLINADQPNLRTVFPLDYDQRHAFKVVFDYRFGEGANYNGPKTKKGGQILKNTGINIVGILGSGFPYSRQVGISGEAFLSPTTNGTDGTLNGARMPWQYRVDLQVDRTFNIKMKSKEEGQEKYGFLNVYLRVTNVLATQNVYGVYRGTGAPNDDGYLAAAQYQQNIQNSLSEEAFRNYYSMKVNNPYNYGVPTTIRLGVKFDF